MASPSRTALMAAAALILTGTVWADEKKENPAPRPTPSRPAAHTPPAGGEERRHSGGGAHAPATPPAPAARSVERQATYTPTPTNPNQNRSGSSMPTRPSERSGSANPATDHNRGTFPTTHEPTTRQPNSKNGRDFENNSRSGSSMPQGNRNTGSMHIPSSPGAGRTTQRGNQEVAVRNNGRTSEIRSRDMVIRRGPQGTSMRRAVVERDGHVYSFNRAGYGHVRNAYSYGGREYVVRRYYVGGAAFPRYYRSYGYRGQSFDAYAPSAYYSPYYYGWAYRPWAAPVVFSWGWGRSPWYGYYGNYFTPYQSYPSANLWLTDYMVSQTLESSYRERVESARAAQIQYNDQPQQYAALTPDIKAQIAEEVQRQLSYEGAEAQRYQGMQQPGAPPVSGQDPGYTGVGRMIEDNKSHVLLSNANIDVTTLSGQECSISQGDAIGITPGQSSGEGGTVQVKVLASAGGGCPANSVVSISLQDLQEMVNHVRATIDSGLAAMQKDPNLPRPPSSVPMSVVQSEFASAAPPADPNEAAELQRLNQEASSTEKSVVSESSYIEPPPAASAPPAQTIDRQYPVQQTETKTTELQIGMSPEQVTQTLGKPSANVRAGSKQIMTYQNLSLKLIFTNGKLTEIQ